MARSTRTNNRNNTIRIATIDGHRMTINVDSIPDDKWTPFSGKSSRGIEVHSIHAHIPSGTDIVILSKRNGSAPALHMSIDEFEMLTSKKQAKMLMENAGR